MTSEDQEKDEKAEALLYAQKLESLGLLAGGVAHDFNNLLVAVLSQTSLALAKLPPESPARAHLEKAAKAAERASSLTAQLLTYSGHRSSSLHPLHLNTLITDNLASFRAGIPPHISIQPTLADALPLIHANSDQMQRILTLLIANAVEAMQERPGTVTVTTGLETVTADDDYRQYTQQPLPPGQYVSLVIGSDNPAYVATGLGVDLTAVPGIVGAHKGGLQVLSNVEQGTLFKLVFPVAQVKQPPALVPEPDTTTAQQEFLILVIDDEEAVREAVSDILDLQGYKVFAAADGNTGIDLYRRHASEVDLILLDLSMPGLSGEETLRELQQINPEVRVVLSSGYHVLAQQSMHQGSIGFIQKPYNARTLVQEIARYLG